MVFEFNGAPPALLGKDSKPPAFASFSSFPSAAPPALAKATSPFSTPSLMSEASKPPAFISCALFSPAPPTSTGLPRITSPLALFASAASAPSGPPKTSSLFSTLDRASDDSGSQVERLSFAFGSAGVHGFKFSPGRAGGASPLQGDTDAPKGESFAHSLAATSTTTAPIKSLPKDDRLVPLPEMNRDHRRVAPILKKLIFDLQYQHVVSHEEGAHVLAKVIVDELFVGSNSDDVYYNVLEYLGIDSAAGGPVDDAVDLLVERAWRALLDARASYKQNVISYGVAGEQKMITRRHDAFLHASTKRSMLSLLAPINTTTKHILNPTSTTTLKGEAPKEADKPFQPFRFLDLAPELRNWVYEELLAPGHIRLAMIDSRNLLTKPEPKVKSLVQSNILATCSQINREAKDILYAGNAVCVTAVMNLGRHALFDQRLLPYDILPRLTSLVLVLDTNRLNRSPHLDKRFVVEGVCWKQFQDMTGLKKIRICFMDREDVGFHWKGLEAARQCALEQIIERIPAGCEVGSEAREGFEDEYMQEALDERVHMEGVELMEVGGELLEPMLTTEIKAKQGCKSGHARDYRFPNRSIWSGLTELSMGGKFVLGGGK